MKSKITRTISITSHGDNKVSLELTPDITWTMALRMLVSAMSKLADMTVSQIAQKTTKSLTQHPDNTTSDSIREEIAADIADQINYAISNVLDRLSPKDPDLELSSVAIATMENEIIQEAAKRHISIKEALKEYEDRLSQSPYAAHPSGANDVFKEESL